MNAVRGWLQRKAMLGVRDELAAVFQLDPSDPDVAPVLASVETELASTPPNEHVNGIERLLLGKLAGWTAASGKLIFPFLLGCHTRAARSPNQRLRDECRYFVVSYAGLVLVMPEMFEQAAEAGDLGPGLAVKMLLRDITSIPPAFLGELVARFEHEEETFEPLFSGIFECIAKVAKEQYGNVLTCNPHGLFSVVELLIGFKPVAELLPGLSCWSPESAPRVSDTLLGSLLAVSTDDPKLLDLVLPGRADSSLVSAGQAHQAYTTVRMSLASVQAQQHGFLLRLVKVSPALREAVIAFFTRVAQLNAGRAKMQVDPATITPDGTMGNMLGVLLRFCEPFLGPSNPKADLIDPSSYFLHNVDLADETRMSLSDAEYAEYRKAAQAPERPPNFVSAVFFLAVRFFRLSYIYNVAALQRLARHQGELKAHLGRLPQSLPGGTPAAMREMLLKRVAAQLQAVEDGMRLAEVWAFDEATLESVHLLVTLLLQCLLKRAGYDAGSAELIPPHVPADFRALPEYLVECAAEWAVFIGRTLPQFWLRRPLDAVVAFVAAFLDRPDAVRNPYLRSKWVELLHAWAASEAASRLFAEHPVLVRHLPGKLMRFYVEAERTGAASQFYDKFNIRFHIAVILRCLWEEHATLYKPRIVEAAEDGGTFIHFINYLLNDTSYLLDEATAKLAAIQRHQHDQESGALQRLGEEERRGREENFELAQRHCVSLTQLARETLHMLAYLTEAVRAPFMQAEVVDHLAAMLNYDLKLLAGPASSELKVKDPGRYHFEPKAWLGSLLRTYLNLAGEEAFRAALARDERSFDPGVFERAARLLGRLCLGTADDIAAFQRLTQQVVDLRTSSTQEEADLGDIPDAFLDPLMFTLMEDPVTLTTSGVTVDRKTIVAHLLNHQVDPFNRMPITMDQVTPNPALKAEIEAFLAERRSKK